MRQMYRACLLFSAGASVLALLAFGQESPSLGDVARQARRRRQQNKSAQGKDTPASKTSKVITDDELPQHSGPATRGPTSEDQDHGATDSPPASGEAKMSADHWKSQIQAQKNLLRSLEQEIDKLNDSIHFAPGNCVTNCVEWNQRQKQRGVDRLRAQLD